MYHKYADIIIDISHEAIDRTFQYRIPDRLMQQVGIGTKVSIPFGRGNHLRTGYVIGFSEEAVFSEDRIKEIADVCENGVAIEGALIELAAFIREHYGSTMIQALKTVMPVQDKVRGLKKREVCLRADRTVCDEKLSEYERKHARAKCRLLRALMETGRIPYGEVIGRLCISHATLKAMQEEGVVCVNEEGYYRTPQAETLLPVEREIPNAEQRAVIDEMIRDDEKGLREIYLLKGVTGSGKTLVYLEMAEYMVKQGRQAIVLIPEIALTYQTVRRFRARFGDRVTVMHSKLSKGERYDQFERAKNGDVSVMIGPRSALFAPFPNLGIIIMDEEHEASYKSEYPPRYHAREVAIHRAQRAGAMVLLGSATPSVESFYHACEGEYHLLTLKNRANREAALPEVYVVDLRQELKEGNRSIFSRLLQDEIGDRLSKGEQTMLFINRRGFAGFVSCRSCGEVMKCPHCDVSLTEHVYGNAGAKLICHYCGFETAKPKQCPKCQSPYIAGFGIGTQKVEEQLRIRYPEAKVLRMDADTTRNKNAHQEILSSFANGEADILVGTQMIAKGHDFANVTLVGMIAADLSLFRNDFRSPERTFDLLTQAAGRAGRGAVPGKVVIQTYTPDHYSIVHASHQDYEAFYEEEKAYRSLMSYPPFGHLLAVCLEADSYDTAKDCAERLKQVADAANAEYRVSIIGPCDATIAKINDRYRRVFYLKYRSLDGLIYLKDIMERYLDRAAWNCTVSFDLDPLAAL